MPHYITLHFLSCIIRTDTGSLIFYRNISGGEDVTNTEVVTVALVVAVYKLRVQIGGKNSATTAVNVNVGNENIPLAEVHY